MAARASTTPINWKWPITSSFEEDRTSCVQSMNLRQKREKEGRIRVWQLALTWSTWTSINPNFELDSPIKE